MDTAVSFSRGSKHSSVVKCSGRSELGLTKAEATPSSYSFLAAVHCVLS